MKNPEKHKYPTKQNFLEKILQKILESLPDAFFRSRKEDMSGEKRTSDHPRFIDPVGMLPYSVSPPAITS